MNKKPTPENIINNFESYKNEVNKSWILLISSKDILDNKIYKEGPEKISYSHAVAIATMLRTVIENLAFSSFWAENKYSINGVLLDRTSTSSEFIEKIEKINPDWLPKTSTKNKHKNISSDLLKKYYDFLTLFYNKSNEVKVNNLNWGPKDDIDKVIKTFDLILNNLTHLIANHKVKLFHENYAYTIIVKDDKANGEIINLLDEEKIPHK
ncbi:MAG: hypothetical protein ACRC63_02960 [Metamycoplasmataceae bacterium]